MEQLPLFSYGSQLIDREDEFQTAEKRHHPRAKATFPVLVEKSHGLFMNGKTENISHGGAFIRCLEPLQPNEVFQIEFSGAHLDHRMKAKAEVIWSNVCGFDEKVESSGMGVRFTEISPEARTIISGLLSNSPETEHREETLNT
jgi:c-di-GMP-binding flagellar brake protein YcgR